MRSSLTRRAAGSLAASIFFRRGRKLFEQNTRDWDLRLSKLDKLVAGGWLILHDYSKGVFPPTFPDQQQAYLAEKSFRSAIPGLDAEQVGGRVMRKPFWAGRGSHPYLRDYMRLTALFERLGISPPAKILELGCGGGWTAEFLAATGFDVVGTTIAEDDVADGQLRIKSLEVKGLAPSLRFIACGMQSVDATVGRDLFDAAFVYEALHHAFDWRESVKSTFASLKPGGWFLICREPNVLHTCIAYRVARLSNTHEIGFSRGELVSHLRAVGFKKVISVGPKLHCWTRAHWLLAQK